jgi:ParB family chromosome partitioning protein
MGKGLGKGLDALLQMFDDDREELTTSGRHVGEERGDDIRHEDARARDGDGVREIPVDMIDRNTAQPRKVFDGVEMDDLVSSVRANGILQPILLNKMGARFMIVAGERRWRAAKAVGLRTVPAIVRAYTPQQISEIALVENLQRADLNDIEIARGIKKLMEDHLMTQERVSEVLGIARASIANTLRLLALPIEVQVLIEQKELSMGHAKCLLSIPAKDAGAIVSFARKSSGGKMSVRELESLIAKSFDTKKIKREDKFATAELRELENYLTKVLGTRVSVVGTDKRGKIIINYFSMVELERIRSRIR